MVGRLPAGVVTARFCCGTWPDTNTVEALAEDVNGEGMVNIQDLVLVAGAFGNVAGAPSTWNRDLEIAPTESDVRQWLAQARQSSLTDATSQRGILILEPVYDCLISVLTDIGECCRNR